MREILQSIDLWKVTCSVAALLLCSASAGAQRDQPEAAVERLSTEFTTAIEAPRGSYALVERDETILAVDLSTQLPGVSEALRIPFADAPRRVRVLVVDAARTTLVVAGGVRTKLTIIVLGAFGRSSIVWPHARLLAGFAAPILDASGRVMIFVYRDRDTLQLRALEPREPQPAILLARRLDRVPDSLIAEALPGDPRVRVRLGNATAYAPGSVETAEALGVAPTFVHPLFALPRPDRIRLDFGKLEAVQPGEVARGSLTFACSNPGRLPLHLRFRARTPDGARLDVEPGTVVVEGEREQRFTARIELDSGLPSVVGLLEITGLYDDSEPLTELVVEAHRAPPKDSQPPAVDAARIETMLIKDRRVRLVGQSGAVTDEALPCTIASLAGESTMVSPNGSFVLEFPLAADGRVRVQVRDAAGNKSEVLDFGELRDDKPPVVDPSRIKLGLWFEGRTVVRGMPGACVDDTPPLRVRLRVGDSGKDVLVLVREDGSFEQQVPATPGDRIRVVAQDGAQPLNRTEAIDVGRVAPYLQRLADGYRLVGIPHATYRAVVLGRAIASDEPAPIRHVLRGTFDGNGRALLRHLTLVGAATLEVELQPFGGVRKTSASIAVTR
ncbi:MAG: hypothetical protein H6832_11915 [Planctomycetes bacterium]|nr:hypothetical protein [Planctomycetota bacterium]MCB9892692.1 hypothetical protein [Planctomycetota bacterium]MCB9919099.1 hypothetical protein [Planctomycetota bacterium]